MTNYQRWCERLLMPRHSSETFMTWLLKRNAHYGDVQELDFGLYNMLLSIYTDELLARIETMLKELETK
jgi:hypothetical protein